MKGTLAIFSTLLVLSSAALVENDLSNIAENDLSDTADKTQVICIFNISDYTDFLHAKLMLLNKSHFRK